MTAAFIHTMFEYHYARFTQVWDSIMTLTDLQFVEDVAYSHGSLRNHMLHLINDDAQWLALATGRDVRKPLDPQKYVMRDSVREIFNENAAENIGFVQRMDDTMLQRTFTWHPDFLPQPQQITIEHALVHIVNHGTDHRAQMLRVLHDFGAPTFDQDLMGYLIQTGQTTKPD